MQEIRLNTDISYSSSARTALSGDSKSLVKTFDHIRSGQDLPGIVRVEDHDNLICSRRITLEPEEGSGYWEFIHLSPELYLIATDFQYRETRVETVKGEGLLDLHFKVSGELLLELDPENKLSVRGPSLLIWNQPAGATCKEWIVGGAHESSFTLYCRPGLFLNQLGIDRNRLPGIINSFLDGKNKTTEYEIINLNPAMAFSITSFLRSGFTDKFHLLHAKSKAYHLLCDTLQFLCTADIEDDEHIKPLSSYENMRLQEARDILSTEFNPPPTIRELAKKIGLNETKFKRGFKQVFGATIHEYANYHRMQKALELLQTTEMSITDVAQSVGYEYQTSFTAAVKHFFGVTPRQLRSRAKRE